MIEELKKKLDSLNFALYVSKMEMNCCYGTNPKTEVARLNKIMQLRTEKDNVNKELQQLLKNNGSTKTNT
jgi:hypothetical protein